MIRIASLATALAVMTATASAGPLEPAHVSADAKWVVHIDFEALQETTLAEKVREERAEEVEKFRERLQNSYGIDPREELKGVTFFNDDYQPHTGAIVLSADYDEEKVKALLTEKSQTTKIPWDDRTIYAMPLEKAGRSAAEPAAVKEAFIVLVDGKHAVFASSADRAKSAVRVIEGDAESLKDKDESKLLQEKPDGTVFYGAAIDLQEIARNEHVFPILQQHERIVWLIGEKDDKAFEKLTLVAESEEVAQKVKEGLKGLMDLVKVWAGESEALAKMAEVRQFSIEDNVVTVEWEADADDVLAALKDLEKRLTTGHEHRVARPPAEEK